MRKAAVFCTARVDGCPKRYQDWVDYYAEFFRGTKVDLYMINDGPAGAALDLKGVELHEFGDALGRQTTEVFPGWKRSFYAGLLRLSATHRCVAHVESDCYVLPAGRDELLKRLHGAGFWTGWTERWEFPETALMVLNDAKVRDALLTRYRDHANWHEPAVFEREIVLPLGPRRMLRGERIDGDVRRAPADATYLAQCLLANVREYLACGSTPRS